MVISFWKYPTRSKQMACCGFMIESTESNIQIASLQIFLQMPTSGGSSNEDLKDSKEGIIGE